MTGFGSGNAPSGCRIEAGLGEGGNGGWRTRWRSVQHLEGSTGGGTGLQAAARASHPPPPCLRLAGPLGSRQPPSLPLPGAVRSC